MHRVLTHNHGTEETVRSIVLQTDPISDVNIDCRVEPIQVMDQTLCAPWTATIC